MARLKRPTTTSENPSKKFIGWKSNDKKFSYYDKEKKENTEIELPFKFLFLEQYHKMSGWNNASDSRIYSNEVYSIGKETLNVKSFKGGEIASGLYRDVKDSIKNAGAVYMRSIYIMLESGEIANLELKGSAVAKYSDFYNDNKHLLDNQWIEVNKAIDGKKGAVKFSTPDFTIGGNITKAQDKTATEVATILETYMDSYFNKDSEPIEAVEEEIIEDENPF
jgi:hypothetical protein